MFRSIVIQTEDKTDQAEFESFVQTIWKKQNPYESISYSWFEEEMYDRYYPAEDMKMMGIACLVILVIAVMGLLGMVIYTTEKRVKEIGIRKVMGASVTEVVKILSWSFLKLLLLAGIIALPIGIFGGLIIQWPIYFQQRTEFQPNGLIFHNCPFDSHSHHSVLQHACGTHKSSKKFEGGVKIFLFHKQGRT